MNSFTYYNPVRMVFGPDSFASLGELVPREGSILLTYGGGSIRANGVYDRVLSALGDRPVVEFGGIRPNPAVEDLLPAIERVRSEGIGFLLAVGGGSVIDATKFIAAGACFAGGNPWRLAAERLVRERALPLGVVLTLPATGSEMNNIAVISRTGSEEKLAFSGDVLFPRFAVLDPAATLSLPSKQVRNGIVDAFVHVVEQYMTRDVNTPLQDRQAEAILSTLIEEGPKSLADPTDLASRANVMWCASMALKGTLKCGTVTDFATHRIGHELTAFYGVDHAESLAPLILAVWKQQFASKRGKLAQCARRVYGIVADDEATAAAAAIEATGEFFRSLGMPTSLRAFGIDPEDAASRVGARVAERGVCFGENGTIGGPEAAELMRLCG